MFEGLQAILCLSGNASGSKSKRRVTKSRVQDNQENEAPSNGNEEQAAAEKAAPKKRRLTKMRNA